MVDKTALRKLKLTWAVLRYREVYFPHFPPNLVTKKFILGLPASTPHATHPEEIARARTMRLLEEEARQYQDIVILDVSIDARRNHTDV